MVATIYIRLSKRARAQANHLLGLTLPWTCVPPRVERHASGGVAVVDADQYARIQHLPGVKRLTRDPWTRTPRQEVLVSNGQG